VIGKARQMLLWMRYRWRLWKLLNKKRSIQKKINKRFHEATEAGTLTADNSKIIDEIDRERTSAEEDITDSIVSYLFELAYLYRIPTPNFGELEPWETSIYTGRRQLTTKALAEFRAAIRNEQKERWQFWELRAKIVAALVTGLTGVIGTLIGLIAIWKK
jgi:hypothetical protein